MAGGQGNDIYYVDSGDRVFEVDGEGNDIIVAFSSFALVDESEIETLAAAEGTAAINLTGDGYAQSLYGNDGANILNGNGGADYLIGNGGNDTFQLIYTGLLPGGAVTIGDYSSGDLVDMTHVFDFPAGVDLIAGGFIRLTAAGQLQVDANGGSDFWVTVANIPGSGAVTIRYQANGVATDLSLSRSASMTAMAVAAAGMAALPDAEAKFGADTDSSAATLAIGSAQHNQALAPLALDDGGAAHTSALAAVMHPMSVDHPAAAVHAPIALAAPALLDAAAAAVPPAALLAATDGPTHAAIVGATALAAPVIALPAAQMLQAHGGIGPDAAQHSQIVEQVLADALDGGAAQGPDLDSLLAGLASHAGAPMAGIDQPVALASGWSSLGADSPFHAAFALDTLALHQDAPPAAA
jgi:hypothetical protein